MTTDYAETGLLDSLDDTDISTESLKEKTRQLMRQLDAGDIGAATDSIRDLNVARDETLYYEVGRLTRALHNALRDFHLDIGLHSDAEVEKLSEIVDARSRLNYVITMTEDAANRTMDMVEEGAPVALQLSQEAQAMQVEWRSYMAAAANGTALDHSLLPRIEALLDRTAADTSRLHERFTDILMAQGYQDLSGQVIKRVIDLVSDVEKSLVRLVKLASNVELIAGMSSPEEERLSDAAQAARLIQAEGPALGNSSGVVSGQDDVDELLSSLGF